MPWPPVVHRPQQLVSLLNFYRAPLSAAATVPRAVAAMARPATTYSQQALCSPQLLSVAPMCGHIVVAVCQIPDHCCCLSNAGSQGGLAVAPDCFTFLGSAVFSTLPHLCRMDWTDVHYRQLARIITKHTWLYTEMVVDNALIHNENRDRYWHVGKDSLF